MNTHQKQQFRDVPLEVAMLAWNSQRDNYGGREPGKVMIVSWPDRDHDADKLVNSCLAPFSYWSTMSAAERLLQLYIEAFHIVLRDGVSPKAMHAALLVVPEYRESLSDDLFHATMAASDRIFEGWNS